MLSQYPALTKHPELVRQYNAFTLAAERCEDDGFLIMWREKITAVINHAYKLKEEEKYDRHT